MNILVFSWRDPKHPLAGGAEQVMHEHMKGWIKAGNEVTLFSSKSKNFPENEIIDKVKIVRKGFQYLGVQLAGFFYYLKNKEKFDLVVDQFHGIPFFTPLYVKKPNLAVIQEVARNVWFLNPLPFPVNLLIGLIGYIFEPFIFLFYRKTPFMTGSDSAKKDLVGVGIDSKKITIVPHGILFLKPKSTKKEKKKTIIFLGRLSKDKGIEDALYTFSLLKARKNLQFWVIGDPETLEYKEKIEELVKKLDLEMTVKFWGGKKEVSNQKKFELLARSHVLINPSVREGWGLVNIEANSVETPVIAYRSPGLVDSVKNGVNGIIVKKNAPEILAKEVEELLEKPEVYQKLSLGAKKWSQNFSWDKSRKLSLNLISSLPQ